MIKISNEVKEILRKVNEVEELKKEKINKQLSLESYNEDFFSDMNIQNSNLSSDTIENFNSKLYKAVKEKLATDFSNYKFTVYARNSNNHLYVVETDLFKLFPENYIVNNFNTVVYVFCPDIAAEYIEDMGLASLHNKEYKVEIDLSSSIDVIYSKLKQILNSSKINELIKKWPIYKESSKYQRKQKEINDYIYRPGKYDQRESYNKSIQDKLKDLESYNETVNTLDLYVDGQYYDTFNNEEEIERYLDDNNIDSDDCNISIFKTPEPKRSKHKYKIGDKLIINGLVTRDTDYKGPTNVTIIRYYDDDEAYEVKTDKGDTGYIYGSQIISKNESIKENYVELPKLKKQKIYY